MLKFFCSSCVKWYRCGNTSQSRSEFEWYYPHLYNYYLKIPSSRNWRTIAGILQSTIGRSWWNNQISLDQPCNQTLKKLPNFVKNHTNALKKSKTIKYLTLFFSAHIYNMEGKPFTRRVRFFTFTCQLHDSVKKWK